MRAIVLWVRYATYDDRVYLDRTADLRPAITSALAFGALEYEATDRATGEAIEHWTREEGRAARA